MHIASSSHFGDPVVSLLERFLDEKCGCLLHSTGVCHPRRPSVSSVGRDAGKGRDETPACLTSAAKLRKTKLGNVKNYVKSTAMKVLPIQHGSNNYVLAYILSSPL